MQQTVRKKRKKSMEEKIKSNQMKILRPGCRCRCNSGSSESASGFRFSSSPFETSEDRYEQPDAENRLDSGVMKSCEIWCVKGRGGDERRSRRDVSKLELVMKLKLALALLVLASLAARPTRKHFLCNASTISDFDGATFYKAPVGSRIRIACNASHWNDDSISLVLWFKGNPTGQAAQLQPIYTIDARQKPLSSGQARHLVADSFKGRARFVFPQQQQQQQPMTTTTTAGPNSSNNSTLVPFLDLAPIEAEDQGEYRCRVDYRSRPRENFLIILFVLVPPSSVEITDSNGRALEQIYGPLNEGSELKLVCLSKGGRPPPAIVWKRAGHVIDDSYLTLNDFLTLKLANGSGTSSGFSLNSSSSAGQQQQQQLDNNLALANRPPNRPLADNQARPSPNRREASSASGARLAADWLAWPEFNYFHSDGQLSTGAAGSRPLTFAGSDQAKQQQQPQLIDWQVDGTTTTGVNVLYLSELTRAHLTEDWAPPEVPASAAARRANAQVVSSAATAAMQSLPGPKLECHASNAHYDLHSLIKLFAPPSLQESAGEGDTNSNNNNNNSAINGGGPQRPVAGRNSAAASSSPVALAQAIERAIWANVKSASTQSENNELHESQAPSSARVAVAHLHRHQHHHNHHRQQQQPEDAPSFESSAAHQQQQQHWRTSHEAGEPNWPLVIQQQLIRPHQLVVSASSSEQANSSKQTGASHLSRSKLIALEANLRPLDVRITSPGRALTAGQVHEFTCQSTGSRPAARLSWLKDGRRLDPKLAHQFADQTATTTTKALPMATTATATRPLAGSRPMQPTEAYKLSAGATAAAPWSSGSLISQSRLTIKLEREDHNARLTCRAENDHYKRTSSKSSSSPAPPPNASHRTSTGRKSVGMSTPSQGTVLADEQSLDLEDNNNNNFSNESLELEPQDRNWQLEDSLTLNVHYVPQVRLELGNKMLSERIREGQDIYFVCRCDSNPAVNEITWLHNDRPINESRQQMTSELMLATAAEGEDEAVGDDEEAPSEVGPSSASKSKRQQLMDSSRSSMTAATTTKLNGAKQMPPAANLIVSNDSLVLQRVQIEQSGQYNCLASNSEGLGLSNQIELRVLHAPICVATTGELGAQSAPHHRPVVGRDANGQATLSLGSFQLAPKGAAEPLRLACQMLVPDEQDQQQQLDQLEFTWYLNNTFNERRLLARQTSREGDVKLIDAHQSDLLGLPWQQQQHQKPASGGFVRQPGQPHNLRQGTGGGASRTQTKSAGAATHADAGQQRKIKRTVRVAVAYLNLNWDQTFGGGSPLEPQIGQLFCLARNSIGEQRRACLYNIEAPSLQPSDQRSRPDNNQEASAVAQLSCLSVNVTTNSAWIGCDFSARRHSQAVASSAAAGNRPSAHELEITRVEENNDRLQAELETHNDHRLDSSGAESPSRFRFNVLVFSLPDLAPLDHRDTSTESSISGEPPFKQLEANLSSGLLDEPLFAVTGLRANTKYLLEIDDLSQPKHQASSKQQTAWVSLKTLASQATFGSGNLLLNHSESAGSRALTSRPSIRQVTEPHPPDLLAAALISTRSSNGFNQQQQQLYHSASDHASRLLQQRQTSRPQSMWSSMTEALAQLVGFQSGEDQTRSRAKRPPHSSLRANGDAPPAMSYLSKLASLEADGLLALCIGLLFLLLVTLISLLAMHRSQFCARRRGSQRHSRASHYELGKLSSPSLAKGFRPSSETEDEQDERDGSGDNTDEQKRPQSLTSTASNSTTPPKKQQLDIGATLPSSRSNSVSGGGSCLAASLMPAGQKFQNHHYSTLNSRLAHQHPVIPSINQQQQQALTTTTINFLKSSSISSGSATARANDWRASASLQRHQQLQALDHHHHHPGARRSPVMILQTAGHSDDHRGQFVPTVSRSRSSLGFGGDGAALAGESGALVLLAQMQATSRGGDHHQAHEAGGLAAATTVATTTRQRLMQSGDGDCATRDGAEQTSLLPDELRLQSGKWLISDANFPFPQTTTTTTSSEIEGELQQQQQQQQQRESWPYIEIKASNRLKLNSNDNSHELRGDTSPESGGLYAFGSARLSKLSPASNDCCNNESNHHQCSCNELSLSLANNCQVKPMLDELTTSEQLAQSFLDSFGSGICCPASQQQGASGFIELLPNTGADSGFNEPQTGAILAYGHHHHHHHQHHNQQAYQLAEDGQRSIESTPSTILLPVVQQRVNNNNDKHYHHVIFNQSLNSSSIGSPSTNNQYGSSPLGSLTNTNSSQMESYQHNSNTNDHGHENNNNNSMLLATSSDEHPDGDINCRPSSKRDSGRLSELASNATNTSNYSSDGSSPVAATNATARTTTTTNQRPPPVKGRLASILKNCNHSINDAPTSTTTTTKNPRPTTNDQSGVVCDNED